MDQSANQPNDYQQKTETLTFISTGLLERVVPIQILEDTIVENTETLLVKLTTTDSDVTFPNGDTASISISDDDGTFFCLLISGKLYPDKWEKTTLINRQKMHCMLSGPVS